MTTLEDAYNQYRELGFILNPSEKNKKFPDKRVFNGSYRERENSKFSKKATGYAGIIPPNIIIVDNDAYEDDNEFARFVEDLGWEPQPFALTPSGGEHYAFENPYPDMVVKAPKYKAVDIFAGYQSVIPIVGTQVINKQGELGEYEWDGFDDTFIVNRWDDKLRSMLNLRERGERGTQMERDDIEQAIIERDMSDDDVTHFLSLIDPNKLDWDSWVEVGMALYDRYAGSDAGREKWVEWSKRSELCDPSLARYVDPAEKWDNGGIKPDTITYKRLANMASEYAHDFKVEIASATDSKTIKKLITKIAETKRVQTRDLKDSDVRDEFAVLINSRLKELKKNNPLIKIAQARSIVKELQYEPSEEEKHEEIMQDDALADQMLNLEIYSVKGNTYAVQYKTKIAEGVSTQFLEKYRQAFKISNKVFDEAKNNITYVESVKHETDYLIENEVTYEVRVASDVSKHDNLHVLTNPLSKIIAKPERQDIVEDFFNGVWQGIATDLIRLVGLTMRFGEKKKNIVHLVAPSNTGKTALFENIGFQTIHMTRLINAMNGDKGVGKHIIDGLKSSGLLLLDEANKPLTDEIKNMADKIQLDQFGQGGTQEIKLHFTVMTSTHKTAIRNMSDEMSNRIMLAELPSNARKVDSCDAYLHETDVFTETVTQQCLWLLKDALINPDVTKSEYVDLKNKYNMQVTSDMDDLMLDVSERVISMVKDVATYGGNYMEFQGEYFVKRKRDMVEASEDFLGENSHIDPHKYSEILLTHFIPSSARKTIKVEGIPIKYYKVNMSKFYTTDEQEVYDEFEDETSDKFE